MPTLEEQVVTSPAVLDVAAASLKVAADAATTDSARRALARDIKRGTMPGIGAGKSVRQILQDATADVTSALTEFAQMVADKRRAMAADIRANGALVVKKMDDDHHDTNDAFAEMLGNEYAGSDVEEKKPLVSDGSSAVSNTSGG